MWLWLLFVLPALALSPPEGLQRGHIRLWKDLEDLPTAVVPALDAQIDGRVFYEDRRQKGRPQDRRDLHGDPGSLRGSRSGPQQHYLGAQGMSVTLLEQDRRRGDGCVPWEVIDTVQIAADGRFSIPTPATDRCQRETDSQTFWLVVQTRQCTPDRCMQVGATLSRAYQLWYPLTAHGDVGDLLFSPQRVESRNRWSKAANHFASLVDAAVILHDQEGLPFRLDPHGALSVRFPSRHSAGSAPTANRIEANNRGWPKGNLLIHEYAHIVHRRAWGGDYAGHPNPMQPWNARLDTPEEPFIAFKEGWANFIVRHVTDRCAVPRFDVRAPLPSLDVGMPGNHFPENHTRALCDWVDDRVDVRDGVQGSGDELSESLLVLWTALDMADAQSTDNQNSDGLDLCDVVAVYLNGVHSPEQLGQTAHAHLTWKLSSLLENNDITCPSLPPPSALRSHDLTLHTEGDEGGLHFTVTNIHAFLASPEDVLHITHGSASATIAIPTLSPGATHTVTIQMPQTPWSAHLQDPTGRDVDPQNHRAQGEAPEDPGLILELPVSP